MILLKIADLSEAIPFAKFFILIFFTILFLQSGWDKIQNKQANLDWLNGHFSTSFLAKHVPLLLLILTCTELAAGAFCALGGLVYFFHSSTVWAARLGLQLSALSLVMLFFGQRMAKDYAGAASIIQYFLVALVGLFLFS